MYIYVAIWLAGFLAFVIMSTRNYKDLVREFLPKVLPESRRGAKRYMLLESLLFVLGPEIAMIWMAIMPFTGIDIMNLWVLLIVLAVFTLIMLFSIGISGIYGEKWYELIPKENEKIGAAQ